MDWRNLAPSFLAAAVWLSCAAAAFDTLAFDEGFTPLFGDGNLVRSRDGRSVRILLNRSSGAGFISSDMYGFGFFSASIKLPSDYTAGVVVAFYTSNADVFEKTHDELDFEFLGNIRGKDWKVQTNIYGNGSVSRGREERYFLPFDPSKDFHTYSILWTSENIIFYVDEIPIRWVRRSAMGEDYPMKPMSLYATIWDASNWATSGGRYKVNYRYGPFVSEFTNLALVGCRLDPIRQAPSAATAAANCTTAAADAEALAATGYAAMTPAKVRAMREFREGYMAYSHCYDTPRYPDSLPGCEPVDSERERLKENGHSRLRQRRHTRRRGRASATKAAEMRA